MRLKTLRVRNFRTVREEQTLELTRGLTIVGPNNTGKTNLLTAVQMFYTGRVNQAGYSRERDLPIGKQREQTTMVATFERENDADDSALEKYDRLLNMYNPPRTRDADEIVFQLIFGPSGTPAYRLSSDSTTRLQPDQQTNHSRLLHDLLDDVIGKTTVHFVPSSNSSEDLFREVVAPLVKQNVARKLTAEITAIGRALTAVADELSGIVRAAGLQEMRVHFDLPDDAPGGFLSHLVFDLADPSRTSAFVKGRGIQALAMLACFAWIAKTERESGVSSMWLIEEPESYLHPDLYASALDLIASIEANGQVVRTTHALTMVPRSARAIVSTTLSGAGATVLRRFETTAEATAELRGSLGVKFSDFFGLGRENVFTEGPSDVELIQWAVARLGGADTFPHLAAAHFRDFGGVSHLEGFLQANFAHIRPETPVVSAFDGDDAGVRAIRAIKGYLSNHASGFESGVDYVIARGGRAIEGVFPDDYLAEAKHEHAGWFDDWIPDASGRPISFTVHDRSKRSLANWLRARAERATSPDEWTEHWMPFLTGLETALANWRPGRR